jgi:hypothetical protein
MYQYLGLLGVSIATGLVFGCAAWLFVRAMKYARGSSPLVARVGIFLAAFCGLGASASAHVAAPISIETLRLFMNSGWGPLLWWGACILATWIPSMRYMSQQLGSVRAQE